jgi:hypothetical protein
MDLFNCMLVGFTISVLPFTLIKVVIRIIGLPQLGFLKGLLKFVSAYIRGIGTRVAF